MMVGDQKTMEKSAFKVIYTLSDQFIYTLQNLKSYFQISVVVISYLFTSEPIYIQAIPTHEFVVISSEPIYTQAIHCETHLLTERDRKRFS